MSSDPTSSALSLPRIMIAGLRGSGGKTLVSVGIADVLRRRGRAVVPFKKGADYIDSAWLAAAARCPCRNLDLFMLTEDTVLASFVQAASRGELSVIEGNRGLFDGADAAGTYSTAELAKLLRAPVILVCDCTKTTRTLGAMVMGCRQFDKDLELCGVILNRVAGRRHEKVLREVVEGSCKLPVLGAIPKLAEDPFPERHLGLVPPQEHARVPAAVQAAGSVVEDNLNVDAIERIARNASPLDISSLSGVPGAGVIAGPAFGGEAMAGGKPAGDGAARRPAAGGAGARRTPAGGAVEGRLPTGGGIPEGAGDPDRPSALRGSRPMRQDATREGERVAPKPRLAVFRDEAFQFYYPENLEALEREGAVLTELSPLKDKSLGDDVDAIYIGGGFPEMFAENLSANKEFCQAVAEAVDRGVPVYAECAGAVYLGAGLIMGERTYPMTGALPVVFGFGAKPQWHGYSVMEVVGENPFYSLGESFRGHEFHYTRVIDLDDKELSFAFRVRRGHGIDGARDGMCRKNTLATYCHVHALGVRSWAQSLVLAAELYRRDMRERGSQGRDQLKPK